MHAGDTLGGRYELVEQIGAGGMGEVWRATQTTLGRTVAIKVLHPLFRVSSPDLERRFRREAELVAKVDHRNVIDVIDFGSTPKGDQFLVMPFLVGETLEQRFRRAPRPDVKEIISIARSVLGGLAAIHDAGIVHRDLKPANVFLARDADGMVPKLLDFGISREAEAPEGTALTQDGTMMGTPHYMALEQFESAKTVDHRADLFSIGAILYEALAGRPPYQGADPFAVFRTILESDPPSLASLRPEVPEPLVAMIHKAIAKKAGDRFQSAREMREAIDRLIASGTLEGLQAADFPTLDEQKVHDEISTAPTAMADSNHGPDTPVSRPTPAKNSRGLFAALALAIGGAGAFVLLNDSGTPEPAPAESAPPLAANEANSEANEAGDPEANPEANSEPEVEPETPWTFLGSSERVEGLALRWARMPDADRSLSIRFVSFEGGWSAIAESLSEADATRIAEVFGGEAAPATSIGPQLQPALLKTTVRLNVHERAEAESVTLRVIPHDTLVVGLYGTLDGSTSAPADDAMTYFVTSYEDSGWAVSRFLERTSSCLPIPAALVREQAIRIPETRRTFTAARTTIDDQGNRRPVWLLMGRDAPGAKSVIGVYDIGRRCRPGEAVHVQPITGVIDEVFLTEAGDGSLLVASWHPDEHSPSNGQREWAAWNLANGDEVWRDSLPSAPFLERARLAAVSGTRDRILRNREGIALTIRKPGTPRTWFALEDGRLVETAAAN